MSELASWRRCLFGLVAVVLVLLVGPARAETKRVALVVGNADYQHVDRLANPRNDARDIAGTLQRLGFEVDLRFDLGRVELGRAVQQLARRGQDAETVLFYYAGHGVQKDRIAYLVPTDATLESEYDLPLYSVRLGELLAPLDSLRQTTLVFLDACRNDPFAEPEGGGTRGLVASSGVGSPSAAGGMLIAYATGEGDFADDGRERNSPFTKALLEHLETPGLEVKSMLTKVRQELLAEGGRQLSETSDRLIGEFYFKPVLPDPATAAATGATEPPPGPASLAARADYVLWEAIKSSSDPQFFELFVKQYPDSPIAPLAQMRLNSLRSVVTQTAKPAPPPPPAPPPAPPVRKAEEKVVAALPPAQEPAPTPAPAGQRGVLAKLPPADAQTRYVTGTGVNLREGRSTRSARLGFLKRGTPVSIGGNEGGWVEVWTKDGSYGWVSERYLAPTEEEAAAPPKPAKPVVPARAKGELFRDCETFCPELVAVAPGAFEMGSPEDEPGRDQDEGPQRQMRLAQPLAVGRLEITFAEWDACVADGGCGGYRPDDEGWGRGRRPVINVSFEDAQAYAAWLAKKTGKPYRLPSEAEWEYAARAGSTGPSPWGDEDSRACRFANLHDETSWRENAYSWPAARCSDGHAASAPAGKGVANAFGLADMLGNVSEWTADCWQEDLGSLPGGAEAAASGDCERRALRGGDWRSGLDSVRYAARVAAPIGSRTASDGFRIVRNLEEGLHDGPPPTTVAGSD